MSYRNCTNAEIVTMAKRGEAADTKTGNFWTAPGSPGMSGHMPRNLANILVFQDIFGLARRVEQTIYSYQTPIAMLIEGVWIVPDISYSTTTSTKHMSQLWRLGNVEFVPWDASAEEIERVISGKMRFTHHKNSRTGRTVPGPNWELD